MGYKRDDQSLPKAEERYRLLFDSNPHPVWVYDLETLKFLDVNRAAIEKYGYSRKEFLSMTIKDIRPSEEIPALMGGIAEVAEGAGALHHRMRRHLRKDGTLIEVDGASHPIVYEGREARLVVATDVTERLRAEEALRRSEERFRLMVSAVKDYAILMLDPQGRVISWNAGAERIKGYRAEEIIGQHFSRFYPAEAIEAGTPSKVLKAAAEQGRFEDEGWRLRKDGSRFWANVVITALRDEKGALHGFGKVTRDMTERKRAEREILLRTAELEAANKELEAFSYSVSHDLRAPLRGIDGFSQALLEDYAERLDDTARNYLQRVRSATQRMGVLIDDLLTLSRVTRAEMHREPIDLSQLAGSIAVEFSAAQPSRHAEFRIAPGVKAEGDARLIRVVLQNLLDNAWKFTSRREQALIEFGRVHSNGKVAFFVKDNGAGFDPAHADGLFGAFQRLHSVADFPGTGIGLATVQRIVRRHGGQVWATGEVNEGATIFFTL
jgi:PAS domain S-box-containing protein